MHLVHPAVGLVAQLLKLARQALADLARAAFDLAPVAGLYLHLFGKPAFQSSEGCGVGVFDGVAHKFFEQRQGIVKADGRVAVRAAASIPPNEPVPVTTGAFTRRAHGIFPE